ncbi:MAG: hypothetical protein CSA29_01845 [Desulfobacterales bacterium]|nr:MAG: hypothetical protein CSA29_01845 [Desulfobacterales bacterium]
MAHILGIRREDKNKWERRVPIIPEDLAALQDQFGIQAIVQPSNLRVYQDSEYTDRGIMVAEDLNQADTIFAVKEIPTQLLAENKTYIYFSHTIKGQAYNMDMLRTLMDLKCNLIDYERIVNEKNQRLIFFSVHAGYSGMIETLYAFAEKMRLKGFPSELDRIKQSYAYTSLEAAKKELEEIGAAISEKGLPKELCPLVVGFTGDGNVSKGAQEIFDIFPFKTVTPDQIENLRRQKEPSNRHLYKVIFKEEHLVTPLTGSFELQDYYDHPEKYTSQMDRYLPYLDILVNCIYWTDKYPRIITNSWLQDQEKRNEKLHLSVVGDISCDIEGSIEITKDATMPDNACFTYHPGTDSFDDGIVENGITVMAIDNLPCEFPKESSMFFSNVLKGFANDIVNADFSKPYDEINLPYPIKKALILQNGELTPDYTYMEQFI